MHFQCPVCKLVPLFLRMNLATVCSEECRLRPVSWFPSEFGALCILNFGAGGRGVGMATIPVPYFSALAPVVEMARQQLEGSLPHPFFYQKGPCIRWLEGFPFRSLHIDVRTG